MRLFLYTLLRMCLKKGEPRWVDLLRQLSDDGLLNNETLEETVQRLEDLQVHVLTSRAT